MRVFELRDQGAYLLTQSGVKANESKDEQSDSEELLPINITGCASRVSMGNIYSICIYEEMNIYS